MAGRRSIPQNAPRVVIVSPALREDNNGNWQTARRWQLHLAAHCPTRITRQWPDADSTADTVMIALHARRSADSIAAWHAAKGGHLAVVLTGTDLYRDIATDVAAQRSLEFAGSLVVLQERAPQALPQRLRHKARVIFQATTERQALDKSPRFLRAVMVGHLRAEKSPDTLFAAARLLSAFDDIHIDHIGDALDPALGREALATMSVAPNYRWLGGLPHEAVRRRIQGAHLLIHASRMEGGAHVIMEAVASGTPVIASRIDGNVGMLGEDYLGYFPWGDEQALADLLLACRESQSRWDGIPLEDGIPLDDREAVQPEGKLRAYGTSGAKCLLSELAEQCRARAHLFLPQAEQASLLALVADLIGAP